MSTMMRIATLTQNGRGCPTVAANRERMLALVDRALLQQPDLICLPEAFTKLGVDPERSAETAEPVPGPTVNALACRAREHHCNIICPIRTLRSGVHYNSAVVIDRTGAVSGIYDKEHPVTTSADYTVFERGIAPVRGPAVFDLDAGRIGIQICFDVGFPESWAALASQGARLIVWPSAYDGGYTLQTYARLHRLYVVPSVRVGRSRIIDPCGQVVAQTGSLVDFAVADVNLDYAVCHTDFNFPIPDRILDAYPGRVRVTVCHDEGLFLVEPTDRSVTVAALQREFGFETYAVYHQRHRDAFARVHAGQPPLPQAAAHGNRAMYEKNEALSPA